MRPATLYVFAFLAFCLVSSRANADCKTIAGAAAAADLTGLTTALALTGLADVFNIPGDDKAYTVCAPTDEAFTILSSQLGVSLTSLNTEQIAQVKEVLLAHAVEGSFTAETLAANTPKGVPTLAAGKLLDVDTASSGGVTVTLGGNIANIIKPNAAVDLCGGSVVHIIDQVMLPPNFTLAETAPSPPGSCETILEAATKANLTALKAALVEAGIAYVFNTAGDTQAYTLCAPTNEAFLALSNKLGGPDSLTSGQIDQFRQVLLVQILLAHAVKGSFPAAALAREKPSNVSTLTSRVFLSTDGETVTLGDNVANIIKPDAATNLCGESIVHIIDQVMLPRNLTLRLGGDAPAPITPTSRPPSSTPPGAVPSLSPPQSSNAYAGLVATLSMALGALSMLLSAMM